MKRIAIIIGHNAAEQGAVRVTDGQTEYVWNGRLADMIAAHNPDQVGIFHRRKNPAGYRAEIGEVYALADEWGADVTCELHFNSFAGSATGTETWHATAAGLEVAKPVQKAMVGALGLSGRGCKLAGPRALGYTSMVTGRAPAVLIEPYFGSNPTDCRAADANRLELAAGLFAALGGKEAQQKPDPIMERMTALEFRVRELEVALGRGEPEPVPMFRPHRQGVRLP